MCSPKKKSRKRAIDSNKRGDYQKFDEFSSQIRDPVIESYAKKVITHVAANDGSCKQGFVKKLVDMAAEVAPALKISRDDINNRVRRIPSNSNRKFHQQFHTMQLTAQPFPQILT